METNFIVNFVYNVLSISSCRAVLLRFIDLKAFSNSSKVRKLYFMSFSTGNEKNANVLEVFYILLSRFGPILINYLLNSSVM